MDKAPMDKRKLKGWLNSESLTDWEKQFLIRLWDTLMLWSGFEGYHTIKEIAYQMGIPVRTVNSRIAHFKKSFPDAYAKLKAHRDLVKRVARRHGKALSKTISWDALDPDLRDSWIVEKF